MTTRLPPDAPYAGRSPDVVPLNISLEREAARLIRLLSPTTKGMGRFVSRLVFEHVARLEERQRLRDKVLAAVGASDKDPEG
jgi:hypothetical protein